MRLNWVGVGWRAQQHAGVRLEIEGFVEADQHRPALHVLPFRRREEERRAAFRLQAQRRDAGQRGDPVAPGARRVDQHRCAEALAGAAHFPESVHTLDGERLAVQVDAPAVVADAAQVALQQGVGVDVGGGRVVHSAVYLLPAQRREHRAGLVDTQQTGFRDIRPGAFELALQFLGIALEVHDDLSARAEQWMLGEALRRCIEEGAAGTGQRAYLRRAVGRGVQRGGAAAGVVAGMRLAFQHRYPAVS
ncbi:hypothetical protein D3C76_817240 [compost metagenome]